MYQAFAYWTSCAIASYEIAASKSKTSASEKQRLHNIATEMLGDLRIYLPPGNDPKDKQELDDCVERLKRAEEYHNPSPKKEA